MGERNHNVHDITFLIMHHFTTTHLIFADHVVATAIFLNRGFTLGTFLCVGRDPVGGLAIIITLFDPLLDEVAADRVVPVFATAKAEDVGAATSDRPGLHVLHLDGVRAVWSGAPLHQSVALDEIVADEVMVLCLDFLISHQSCDGLVIH